MRTIKLRVKTYKNDWCYFSIEKSMENPLFDEDLKCNPETVGLFTGFLDKNGKEIYEGDVIRMYSHNGNTSFNRLILFRGGMFAGYFEDNKRNYFGETLRSLVISTYEVTVIGNIYDNPELLTM